MFQNRRNLLLIALTGYLCLFMSVLPCRLDGALLKSKESVAVPDYSGITQRLIELGMSREKAEQKVALLRQVGISLNKNYIFAGGENKI